MDGSGGKWELRHAKSHPTAITPLTRLKWWRLVMDEAQMVGTRMSLVSQVRSLNSRYLFLKGCVAPALLKGNAMPYMKFFDLFYLFLKAVVRK